MLFVFAVQVRVVVLVCAAVVVVGRPQAVNPDSELLVGPSAPLLPAFLPQQGEGFIVGEVLVSSPNVAVKRRFKKWVLCETLKGLSFFTLCVIQGKNIGAH